MDKNNQSSCSWGGEGGVEVGDDTCFGSEVYNKGTRKILPLNHLVLLTVLGYGLSV